MKKMIKVYCSNGVFTGVRNDEEVYKCISEPLIIPDTVVTIKRLFSNGVKFKNLVIGSLKIGDNVEVIDPDAFENVSIVRIEVSPKNTHFVVIDGGLYYKYPNGGLSLVHCTQSKNGKDFKLNEKTVDIRKNAFTKIILKNIELNKGLKKIADGAIGQGCCRILIFNSDVKDIGENIVKGTIKFSGNPKFYAHEYAQKHKFEFLITRKDETGKEEFCREFTEATPEKQPLSFSVILKFLIAVILVIGVTYLMYLHFGQTVDQIDELDKLFFIVDERKPDVPGYGTSTFKLNILIEYVLVFAYFMLANTLCFSLALENYKLGKIYQIIRGTAVFVLAFIIFFILAARIKMIDNTNYWSVTPYLLFMGLALITLICAPINETKNLYDRRYGRPVDKCRKIIMFYFRKSVYLFSFFIVFISFLQYRFTRAGLQGWVGFVSFIIFGLYVFMNIWTEVNSSPCCYKPVVTSYGLLEQWTSLLIVAFPISIYVMSMIYKSDVLFQDISKCVAAAVIIVFTDLHTGGTYKVTPVNKYYGMFFYEVYFYSYKEEKEFLSRLKQDTAYNFKSYKEYEEAIKAARKAAQEAIERAERERREKEWRERQKYLKYVEESNRGKNVSSSSSSSRSSSSSSSGSVASNRPVDDREKKKFHYVGFEYDCRYYNEHTGAISGLSIYDVDVDVIIKFRNGYGQTDTKRTSFRYSNVQYDSVRDSDVEGRIRYLTDSYY